jgi:ribonuclease HII
MIIEPKADLTYTVVGAASIYAKVHRDAQIEALGAVGSGYPSDPKTRAWIRGFFERNEPLPDCVRKRWGTVDALRQQALL